MSVAYEDEVEQDEDGEDEEEKGGDWEGVLDCVCGWLLVGM